MQLLTLLLALGGQLPWQYSFINIHFLFQYCTQTEAAFLGETLFSVYLRAPDRSQDCLLDVLL